MNTKMFTHFLSKNSTNISTGLSVVSLGSTVALTIDGTAKAVKILEKEEKGRGPLTKIDIIKLTWKCYIPAGIMAGITVGCIIGTHTLHLRKQAALAGAYSLAASALKEYKGKIVETLGEKKAAVIDDSIKQDTLKNNPVKDKEVYITGMGETLCRDSLSGRYFKSDMETIRKAENDLRRDLRNEMWLDLNAVYDALGIPPTRLGAELGWSIHDSDIEFKFSTLLADNNVPCLMVDYVTTPYPDYGSK